MTEEIRCNLTGRPKPAEPLPEYVPTDDWLDQVFPGLRVQWDCHLAEGADIVDADDRYSIIRLFTISLRQAWAATVAAQAAKIKELEAALRREINSMEGHV